MAMAVKIVIADGFRDSLGVFNVVKMMKYLKSGCCGSIFVCYQTYRGLEE